MKNIISKAIIKEIVVSLEKKDQCDITKKKQRPIFNYGGQKKEIVILIQMTVPIPLENHEFLPQLGRFTLSDDGKELAEGMILKFKKRMLLNEATEIVCLDSEKEDMMNESIKTAKTMWYETK